ncbi:39k protein [Catopsilia pomona nucleopolyhedrovirus]|uniref:39k protein n=1 Tax=Catopsilia pomona nucleopolyhedrovirus TaxID=1850906 RepID=A0A172WZH7_9ABAC|nr:39k protein [Catopsilia pomona nucleopolyhedrovirus]ANF29750.1 39k protein [Catopsilia pomona nucleopolyhedrovirus]
MVNNTNVPLVEFASPALMSPSSPFSPPLPASLYNNGGSNKTTTAVDGNLFDRIETSVYNKSNMDQLRVILNLMEKKKYNYTINVTPVLFDERKMLKRNKKMINNNKYILFNSWYTKIKRSEWPSSPAMWYLIKNKNELADFVFIFDYTEKMGKKLADRSSQAAPSSVAKNSGNSVGRKRKNAVATAAATTATADIVATTAAEFKENCEMRDKLYLEFYNVLNETFKHDAAPLLSHIYDDVLTREFISKNMEKFKSVALKIPLPSPSLSSQLASAATYVPTAINKKRKNSLPANNNGGNGTKRASKTKRNNTAAVATATTTTAAVTSSTNTPATSTFSMVSDNTQDTNMSY